MMKLLTRETGREALRYGLIFAALVVGGGVGAAFSAVLAQVVVPVPGEVDVSNISTFVMQFVITLLGGILSLAGLAARTWLIKRGMREDSEVLALGQKAWNEMSARSMSYAETYGKALVPGLDGKLHVNNQFINDAVYYANRMWPEMTAGIDPAKLADSFIARLPTGEMAKKAEEVAAANAGASAVAVPAAVAPPKPTPLPTPIAGPAPEVAK